MHRPPASARAHHEADDAPARIMKRMMRRSTHHEADDAPARIMKRMMRQHETHHPRP